MWWKNSLNLNWDKKDWKTSQIRIGRPKKAWNGIEGDSSFEIKWNRFAIERKKAW